jgi:hypothetical protein
LLTVPSDVSDTSLKCVVRRRTAKTMLVEKTSPRKSGLSLKIHIRYPLVNSLSILFFSQSGSNNDDREGMCSVIGTIIVTTSAGCAKNCDRIPAIAFSSCRIFGTTRSAPSTTMKPNCVIVVWKQYATQIQLRYALNLTQTVLPVIRRPICSLLADSGNPTKRSGLIETTVTISKYFWMGPSLQST